MHAWHTCGQCGNNNSLKCPPCAGIMDMVVKRIRGLEAETAALCMELNQVILKFSSHEKLQ